MIHSPCYFKSGLIAVVVALVAMSSTVWAQDHTRTVTPRSGVDPASADYFAAQGLLQKQLHDLAAKEFEKFLKSYPKHELAPMARYGLAICRFQTSDFAGAIRELLPLSRQKDFQFAADVGVMLAQSRLAQQEWKQAASDARKVLESFPDHGLADDAASIYLEAMFRLGATEEMIESAGQFGQKWKDGDRHDRILYFHAAALIAQQEWDTAAKPLADLLSLHPESALVGQTNLLLAQSAERRGDRKAASTAYRRLTERPEQPLQKQGWLGLARILRQDGDATKAMEALDRVGTVDSGDELGGHAAFLRGQLLFDSGDFSGALKWFDAGVVNDASLSEAAGYWGAKCAIRLADYPGAIDRLNNTIQAYPEGTLAAECRYDLAYAHSQLDDPRQAASIAVQLLRDHPDHPLAADATYLAALALQNDKQFDESRKYTRIFDSRYFDHPLLPQVKLMAAENEYLSDRWSEAAASFRAFLDEFPRHEQAGWVRQRLGFVLYRLERFDEALGVLALGIDGNEEDVGFRATLLALGDMYFRKGEYDKAIEHLQKYVKLEPDAAGIDDALMKLGVAYSRTGRNEKAVEVFDQLLGKFPETTHLVHAMFEKGQCHLALEQSEAAHDLFEKVAKSDRTGRFAVAAMNHLGSMASAAGDTRLAAEWFSRSAEGSSTDSERLEAEVRTLQAVSASGEWAEAEHRARELIKRRPAPDQAANISGYLALALSRQGKTLDALGLLEDLSDPEWNAMSEALRQSCLLEQVVCLRKQKSDAGAKAVLHRLLSMPISAEYRAHALLSMAEIEASQGKCEDARSKLQELVSLVAEGGKISESLSLHSRYLAGKCAYDLQDYEAAASTLDSLLTAGGLGELKANVLALSAESNFRLKKHRQALTALEQLISDYPDHSAVAVSLLRSGECHAELGQWPQSEAAYQAYIDRFPKGEFAYQARFGIGWALEHQQQIEKAIDTYRTVIASHRGITAARAQFQIGECLFALGKHEEAIAEFTKVEVMYPDTEWSPAAGYEAARCLKAMNKPVEAKAQFESVAARFAQTQWGRLAAESLGTGM